MSRRRSKRLARARILDEVGSAGRDSADRTHQRTILIVGRGLIALALVCRLWRGLFAERAAERVPEVVAIDRDAD